jgi:ATP-dependent DNA ligase
MAKRKSEILFDIQKRQIKLDPEVKYTNMMLRKVVAKYEMGLLPKEKQTWALKQRLFMDTPMLSFRFDKAKPEQQEEMLNSEDWIAEVKFNGCRMIMFYHPDEGFHFFSRNYSDVNHLPLCYTEKILLIQDGKIQLPESFKNKLTVPFILDCEIVAQGNIDTTVLEGYGGNMTESEQNATAALLSLNAESSNHIQMEQAPLKFHVFDLLYYKDWWIDRPLKKRKALQESIVNILKQEFNLPFENSEVFTSREAKEKLFAEQLANGGEGIMLKNVNKPYSIKSSRKRDVQVKYKRSMANTKPGDMSDIDAFITGFLPGNKGTQWEKYVGSVQVSVLLRNNGEGEKEHHIATISGIPFEKRKEMTTLDAVGNPVLKKDFYGKVVSIDGMSVSPKSLRFSHAKARSWDFRTDKDPADCIMEERYLKQNII